MFVENLSLWMEENVAWCHTDFQNFMHEPMRLPGLSVDEVEVGGSGGLVKLISYLYPYGGLSQKFSDRLRF